MHLQVRGAPCHFTKTLIVFVDTSQCTYRCAVLPATRVDDDRSLWGESQCTYRCAVLPDEKDHS